MSNQNGMDVRIASAVQLAGSGNIYGPLVGRILYKRVCDLLAEIREPGVLILDFVSAGVVATSTLLISVVKAVAFSRRQDRRKTIVCINASRGHIVALRNAVDICPDALDPFATTNPLRVVLLAHELPSEADSKVIWHLFGPIDDCARDVWEDILAAESTRIDSIGDRLGYDEEEVVEAVQLLVSHQVVLLQRSDAESVVRSLSSLLKVSSNCVFR